MKDSFRLSIFLSFFVGATSALACPGEKYVVNQVSLDANGVVTRSEMRALPKTDAKADTEWVSVVTDTIHLVAGDEIKLNASPGMQDATVSLSVKRASQNADSGGIFSTTYAIRETWTSAWGGPSEKSDKNSLVTVTSNYSGNGTYTHSCGSFHVESDATR